MGIKPEINNPEQTPSGFLGNVLDEYDTPTYHFRLFMAKEANTLEGVYGTIDEQVTIAESGVTAIGIESVEMTSVPGYSSKVDGSGTSLTFKISLKEPFNASLYDKIYEASLDLGISNHNKCPYFLELTFLGNDPTTSVPSVIGNGSSGAASVIGGKKWVFVLAIINVTSLIDASGTKYDIEAASYGDLATSDQASVLIDNVTIPSSYGSLSEATNSLSTTLYDRQKYTEFQRLFNQWEIRIADPELAQSSVKATDPNTDSLKHDSLQFAEGTSVSKIIDMLVSSTKFIQDKAIKSRDSAESETTHDDQEEMVFKTLYKIHTDVEILGFDLGIGDYARKFIYTITTYKIASITASPDEGTKINDTSDYGLSLISAKGRIRKHYNYIYSGLNQQVVSFDLNFNMAWYAALPRRSGVFSHTQSHMSGIYNDTRREDSQLQRQVIMDTWRSQQNNVPQSVKLDDITFKNLEGAEVDYTKPDALNGYVLPVSKQEERTEQLYKPDNSVLKSEGIGFKKDNIAIGVANLYLDQEIAQNDLEQSKMRTPQQQYVEDYDVSGRTAAVGVNSNRLVPLTYKETQEDEDMVSNTNNEDAGRLLFSSLFSQASRTDSGDLIACDMTIKGDPFWLSPSENVGSTKIKYNHELVNDQLSIEQPPTHAGTMNSETFILFTAYLPMSEMTFEGTNKINKKNTAINGVYAIIDVKHKFEGGKFTQVLHGSRVFLIDLDYVNMEKFIDGNTTNDTTVTSSLDTPKVDITGVMSFGDAISGEIVRQEEKVQDVLGDVDAFRNKT